MREYWIIERIEDGAVVLELPNRELTTLSADTLPAGAKEGDCLYMLEGDFRFDPEETERRRRNNSQRLQDLFRKE